MLTLREPQDGQKGRGGKYAPAQASQRCSRSSPDRVPSQKCCVSGVGFGRARAGSSMVSSWERVGDPLVLLLMRQWTVRRQRLRRTLRDGPIPLSVARTGALVSRARPALWSGRTKKSWEDVMLRLVSAVFGLIFAAQAYAADVPSEIKIGTLYASSGRFASISMPVYSSLKLWR